MATMSAGQELRGATPEQITAVVQELERIEKTHEDWVVPGGAVRMGPDGRLVADLGAAWTATSARCSATSTATRRYSRGSARRNRTGA